MGGIWSWPFIHNWHNISRVAVTKPWTIPRKSHMVNCIGWYYNWSSPIHVICPGAVNGSLDGSLDDSLDAALNASLDGSLEASVKASLTDVLPAVLPTVSAIIPDGGKPPPFGVGRSTTSCASQSWAHPSHACSAHCSISVPSSIYIFWCMLFVVYTYLMLGSNRYSIL